MPEDARAPNRDTGNATDVGRLLGAHAELARLEAERAVSDVARSAVMFVAALALLGGAVFLVPALLVLVLANWMPAWLATAVVLLAVLVTAGAVGWLGWRRLRRPKFAVLQQTLKEDGTWLAELMTSLRKSGR
jgi:membrane protein YdbS with pleckstrin-like domain